MSAEEEKVLSDEQFLARSLYNSILAVADTAVSPADIAVLGEEHLTYSGTAASAAGVIRLVGCDALSRARWKQPGLATWSTQTFKQLLNFRLLTEGL